MKSVVGYYDMKGHSTLTSILSRMSIIVVGKKETSIPLPLKKGEEEKRVLMVFVLGTGW